MDAEIKKKFNELARRWRAETRYQDMSRLADHAACQEIVAMGDSVVPLLLAKLEHDTKSCWHWLVALWLMTKVDPVPPEHGGNVKKMVANYIAWGKKQGYKW